MLELSVALKIPVQFLEELDERSIITYWEILDDINDARKDAMKGGA